MKIFLTILVLVALSSVSYAQEKITSVPDPEKHLARPSCPINPNTKLVNDLIESFIEAQKLGHTMPEMAQQSCLDTKTPYRVFIPEKEHQDNSPPTEPFFIRKHKIKSFRKFDSSSFSDDYLAEIELKGKDQKGRRVSIKQTVLFVMKKGVEAELQGCVGLHGGWERPFIEKRCYK